MIFIYEKLENLLNGHFIFKILELTSETLRMFLMYKIEENNKKYWSSKFYGCKVKNTRIVKLLTVYR